ncbi:MAG: TrmB family transcriptional regulator [Candidatus Helarchaeota archaeon]
MKDDKIIEHLSLFKIDKKDSRIYLHLLKSGKQRLSTIAQECGIPRSQAYESLTRLINKGFVFKEITAKQPRYGSISPSVIVDRLDYDAQKQKFYIDQLKGLFDEIMPINNRERNIIYSEGSDNCKINLDVYIKQSKKSIKGFFVLEDGLNQQFMNSIFPIKTLIEKSNTISDINLILNGNGLNKTIINRLTKKGVTITFWNGINRIPIFLLLVDKKYLLIMSYKIHNYKFYFIDTIIFENMNEYINVFDYFFSFLSNFTNGFLNYKKNSKINNKISNKNKKDKDNDH